jgi:hypothetical protein
MRGFFSPDLLDDALDVGGNCFVTSTSWVISTIGRTASIQPRYSRLAAHHDRRRMKSYAVRQQPQLSQIDMLIGPSARRMIAQPAFRARAKAAPGKCPGVASISPIGRPPGPKPCSANSSARGVSMCAEMRPTTRYHSLGELLHLGMLNQPFLLLEDVISPSASDFSGAGGIVGIQAGWRGSMKILRSFRVSDRSND